MLTNLKSELEINNISIDKYSSTLVVSFPRSGSSFLGKLINAYPGTFFSFEPLRGLKEPIDTQTSLDILKMVLTCNFSSQSGHNYWNRGVDITRNQRVWDFCKANKNCNDVNMYQEICPSFHNRLAKVVRLTNVTVLAKLLEQITELKIVVLVRDPRAQVASMRESICYTEGDVHLCQPEIFCRQYWTFLTTSKNLHAKYSSRVTILKYEELASDPLTISKGLFKFLNLTMVTQVMDFIKTHTNSDNSRDPFSTIRESRTRIDRWKSVLKSNEILSLQKKCRKSLAMMNYQLVKGRSAGRKNKMDLAIYLLILLLLFS